MLFIEWTDEDLQMIIRECRDDPNACQIIAGSIFGTYAKRISVSAAVDAEDRAKRGLNARSLNHEACARVGQEVVATITRAIDLWLDYKLEQDQGIQLDATDALAYMDVTNKHLVQQVSRFAQDN